MFFYCREKLLQCHTQPETQSLAAPEETLRGAFVHVSFFFSECGRNSKWPWAPQNPRLVAPHSLSRRTLYPHLCRFPCPGPSDATEPQVVHSWPWQWGCPSTLHVGEDLTEGEKEESPDQKSVCVCARVHTQRWPCMHLSRCDCVSVKQWAEWMEQRDWHQTPWVWILALPLESEREVAQSCLTLCDPMDCSLSGSSVHGIFQARLLEWIAISFSRGSSRPRNRTPVSRIAGRCLTVWATREALMTQGRGSAPYLVLVLQWVSYLASPFTVFSSVK